MRTAIGALLGCDWGWRLWSADDPAQCTRTATAIVVLHDGPHATDVKVCAQHLDAVQTHTDPHASVTP